MEWCHGEEGGGSRDRAVMGRIATGAPMSREGALMSQMGALIRRMGALMSLLPALMSCLEALMIRVRGSHEPGGLS